MMKILLVQGAEAADPDVDRMSANAPGAAEKRTFREVASVPSSTFCNAEKQKLFADH
jgi:hypothetical protein